MQFFSHLSLCRWLTPIALTISVMGPLSASQIILTQSFENPEGTDWSTSLGVNSTGSQITDGTAADGASYLRFTLGENAPPDFSSGGVLGQRVWEDIVTLRTISSTMQIRGDEGSYMVYQVAIPDASDPNFETNPQDQFFVVGGSSAGPVSPSSWTTWSAGQDDPFRVGRYLGSKFMLPTGAVSSSMTLSDIVDLPILLEADGTDTGMTWGDARVRWVTPTAGFAGGTGFNPDVTAELDLLVVSKIPEPTTLAVLGLFGAMLILRRFRKT